MIVENSSSRFSATCASRTRRVSPKGAGLTDNSFDLYSFQPFRIIKKKMKRNNMEAMNNTTKIEKEFESTIRRWSRNHSQQEIDALWKELWSEVAKFDVHISPMEIIEQIFTVKSIQEKKSVTALLVGLARAKTVTEFIDFVFKDRAAEVFREIIPGNNI